MRLSGTENRALLGVQMISKDVVILTRDQLSKIKATEYRRGVERGRFEESCDRSETNRTSAEKIQEKKDAP